jgi:acyl-CoA synthetase (AMP-forming)/AMP-acid ligase II
MIVTGGEKVFSAEVEADIYEMPAVREVAVFGIPDPQWGEVVTAVVVLKPGTSLTAEEITEHCRQSLTHFKCPRRVEFSRAELPKDAAGKILKRALRDRYWAHQGREVA